MNIRFFAPMLFSALAFVSVPPALHAQAPALRYQWTPGQTLRFLIQRDPYFADPKAALDKVSPDAPFRPPVVERLTEKVQAVAADGTATLLLTLGPEPGLEDEAHPQAILTRTVTVTPLGQVRPVSGTPSHETPAERDLLCGLTLLPPTAPIRADGLAVMTRKLPPQVTASMSPGHDGVLRQTTRTAQSDHLVFDCRQGRLVRKISTMTITLSLVMTGRGRRGADDFGHVIPSVQTFQTLTVEQQED